MDVLSCRVNRSDSGIVARVAGDAVGANSFLPNMGTEDFLSCLSRTALEAACKDTPVLPRPRVKDTRAELVKHFSDGRFVHQSALFAPSTDKVIAWVGRYSAADPDELDQTSEASDDRDGKDTAAVAEDLAVDDGFDEPAGSYAVAAE